MFNTMAGPRQNGIQCKDVKINSTFGRSNHPAKSNQSKWQTSGNNMPIGTYLSF